MHKALHSRDNIDGLYVSRKEGWGLVNIDDCVDESIRRLENYIKKNSRTNYSDHKTELTT